MVWKHLYSLHQLDINWYCIIWINLGSNTIKVPAFLQFRWIYYFWWIIWSLLPCVQFWKFYPMNLIPCVKTCFDTIIPYTFVEEIFWLPFKVLMLIEVLTAVTSSFLSISSVTNVTWLHESSKGNIFTSFWKLQCLNLTCTTHILMTSPTKVPKFLIPVQLLLMASVCSPFYLYHYLMFSFSSFYNYIVLMDVSLDIPYHLFYYYCTFLLYELTLSLYGIHSRVYSSSNTCFYLQLKVHCKIGIHPSHG